MIIITCVAEAAMLTDRESPIRPTVATCAEDSQEMSLAAYFSVQPSGSERGPRLVTCICPNCFVFRIGILLFA